MGLLDWYFMTDLCLFVPEEEDKNISENKSVSRESKFKGNVFINAFINTFKVLLEKMLLFFCRSELFSSFAGTAFFVRVKKILSNPQPEEYLIFESINVKIIIFPFSYEAYKKLNYKAIAGYISSECKKAGADILALPDFIKKHPLSSKLFSTGELHCRKISSGLFLKAFIPMLMEVFCTDKGLRPDQIDIIITGGGNEAELISIISILEPFVSCIGILDLQKDELEIILNRKFNDTGLTLYISDDFKSLLKNADVIINNEDIGKISDYRLKKESVFINMTDERYRGSRTEGIVVNGLYADIKDTEFIKFFKKISIYYNKDEITDALLFEYLYRSEGEDESKFRTKLLNEYRKGSIYIKGYYGRHGPVNKDFYRYHKKTEDKGYLYNKINNL